MVLLPQYIGIGWRCYQYMRVIASFSIRIGEKFGPHSFIADLPCPACIGCFKNAGATDADVNAVFISRVNKYRMNARLVTAAAKPSVFTGWMFP